jgi:hypothetical protein
MSSTSGFRSRLILQAVITAVLALSNGTASSGWTIPTLVVAAGAVFVGLAMRAEPAWRWYTVGYEGFAIAFGLVALVSGHYVPGTIIAGWTMYFLLSHAGAGAFAGTPSWAPPTAPVAWGPPVPVPAYAGAAPTYPPPTPGYAPAVPVYGAPAQPTAPPPPPMAAAPVVPPAADVPAQPLPTRPASMTILPGR